MGFVWVHVESFLHSVASPFHSFVTTVVRNSVKASSMHCSQTCLNKSRSEKGTDRPHLGHSSDMTCTHASSCTFSSWPGRTLSGSPRCGLIEQPRVIKAEQLVMGSDKLLKNEAGIWRGGEGGEHTKYSAAYMCQQRLESTPA